MIRITVYFRFGICFSIFYGGFAGFGPMAVLKFFASVKERMGAESMSIQLSEPVPVRRLLEMAAERAAVDPATLINGSFMYAVNQETEDLDHVVGDSDEVAVLPPLSGGV